MSRIGRIKVINRLIKYMYNVNFKYYTYNSLTFIAMHFNFQHNDRIACTK